MDIFFILLLVFSVISCFFLFKSKKIHNTTLSCFVGSLGSGKTYMAVRMALKAYKKQRRNHFFYKICPFKSFFRKAVKGSEYPATLYSNFPIQIKKGKYSNVLKREHLLKLEYLPQRCVVVVDELGAVASQWDYNNPYVLENLTFMIRMFRQFTDGTLIVTDQDESEFVKTIRCRLGTIYYLSNFRRWLFFSPFFKVDVVPILGVTDENALETVKVSEASDYFAGFLPYRWLPLCHHYDSRAYSVLYSGKAFRNLDKWQSLKCPYLIDIAVSKSVSRDYTQNRELYRKYLFEDSEVFESEVSK